MYFVLLFSCQTLTSPPLSGRANKNTVFLRLPLKSPTFHPLQKGTRCLRERRPKGSHLVYFQLSDHHRGVDGVSHHGNP